MDQSSAHAAHTAASIAANASEDHAAGFTSALMTHAAHTAASIAANASEDHAAGFTSALMTHAAPAAGVPCGSICPQGPSRFDVTKLVPCLEDLHERLSGVTIENLDYKDFLRRYDRPGTLFYLDPPYYGNEGDYGRDLFSREEFSAMAEILKALQGRFILSLNDRPEVRRIFAAFTITPVKTTCSVGRKGRGKERGELLIMNGKRRRAATAD